MQYLVFDSNVTQRWRRVKSFVEIDLIGQSRHCPERFGQRLWVYKSNLVRISNRF